MAHTFNVGDVVFTKAGRSHSPLMVVKLLTPDNDYLCIWYNSTTQQFEEYKFPADILIKL